MGAPRHCAATGLTWLNTTPWHQLVVNLDYPPVRWVDVAATAQATRRQAKGTSGDCARVVGDCIDV